MKRPMRNFLIFSFPILIILSLIIGCASSEKSMIESLKEDPKDVETLGKLADHYYDKQEYGNAYRCYSKLDRLDAIDEYRKYLMYISQTRTLKTDKRSFGKKDQSKKKSVKKVREKKGWENIYPLRNTDVVDYISAWHDKLLHIYIPEHWLLISKDIQPSKPVINALDFNYTYPISRQSRITKRSIPDLMNDEGLLYCGKGFIMEYDINAPRVDYNVSLSYNLYNIKKEIDGLIKLFRDKEKAKILKNTESYIFKKVSSKGQIRQKEEFKKIKYTSDLDLGINKPLMGYISCVELRNEITVEELYVSMRQNLKSRSTSGSRKNAPSKKVGDKKGKSRPGSTQKKGKLNPLIAGKKNKPVRKVIIFVISGSGDVILTLNTHFEEKYKKVYLKEIDEFLMQNRGLPMVLDKIKGAY